MEVWMAGRNSSQPQYRNAELAKVVIVCVYLYKDIEILMSLMSETMNLFCVIHIKCLFDGIKMYDKTNIVNIRDM